MGVLFDGKPFEGTRSPHNPLPRLPLLPGHRRVSVLGRCAEQIADALGELNEATGGVELVGGVEDAPDGAAAAVQAVWPEVVQIETWGPCASPAQGPATAGTWSWSSGCTPRRGAWRSTCRRSSS